jgi:hypothetical protein
VIIQLGNPNRIAVTVQKPQVHAASNAPLQTHHTAPFGRNQVSQRIGGIIAPDSIIVRIHFQHILRPVRSALYL